MQSLPVGLWCGVPFAQSPVVPPPPTDVSLDPDMSCLGIWDLACVPLEVGSVCPFADAKALLLRSSFCLLPLFSGTEVWHPISRSHLLICFPSSGNPAWVSLKSQERSGLLRDHLMDGYGWWSFAA